MALQPQQLRKWFLYGGAALLLLVLGFYSYARLRLLWTGRALPARLGVEIQSSTQGFTLSKSEAGRTLFTIHAARAVEYKNGGHAELHDVNIVVYGKNSNRFDQIYGSDFEYDPKSGNVTARGEVHIDLQADAEGPLRPDQAPPQELKNLIHVKTGGLVFNQHTGMAATAEKIDFRLPQASGTAVGATYDSKAGVLDLQSKVAIATAGEHATAFTARRAHITRQPRLAVFDDIRGEQNGRASQADQLTVYLRPDSTVERMLASSNVRSQEQTKAGEDYDVHATQAEIDMGEKNQLSDIVLRGGVMFDASGNQVSHARADKAVIDFGPGQRLRKVRATGNFHFQQEPSASPGKSQQELRLNAAAVDLLASAQGTLQRGFTEGTANIEIVPRPATPSQPAAGRTVITAGVFNASFDSQNRLKTLHGEPDAKIDWQNPVPGSPDRVSTSHTLDAVFDAKVPGRMESVTQQGDIHYSDGEHEVFAQRARYSPQDDLVFLTGSPRVLGAGTVTTAGTVTVNRQTGEAFAHSDVKSTYTNLKPQPGGAMLGSGDSVHVTAREMHAVKASGLARYSGEARLWQGANIVQAPIIDFDRDRRMIVAQGDSSAPVRAVFVETGKEDNLSAVNVTSSRLTYTDADRLAQFEGGVNMTGAEGTLSAKSLRVFLKPRSENPQAASGASQIDHAIAENEVVLQQPGRVARGQRLLWDATEGKFVLTGATASPPTLTDAEHGTVSGDSLTFYNRDDRVLVKSDSTARTVTQTRVPR